MLESWIAVRFPASRLRKLCSTYVTKRNTSFQKNEKYYARSGTHFPPKATCTDATKRDNISTKLNTQLRNMISESERNFSETEHDFIETGHCTTSDWGEGDTSRQARCFVIRDTARVYSYQQTMRTSITTIFKQCKLQVPPR